MTRSFLNLITTDGKQCRLAEFGFYADFPSFDKGSIVFRREEKWYRFMLESGEIAEASALDVPDEKVHISPENSCSVSLEFASEITDGRGYVHMILKNLTDNSEKVIVRFMGSEKSIGTLPFSPDGKSIVFFGYPEKDDI